VRGLKAHRIWVRFLGRAVLARLKALVCFVTVLWHYTVGYDTHNTTIEVRNLRAKKHTFFFYYALLRCQIQFKSKSTLEHIRCPNSRRHRLRHHISANLRNTQHLDPHAIKIQPHNAPHQTDTPTLVPYRTVPHRCSQRFRTQPRTHFTALCRHCGLEYPSNADVW